MNSIKHCNLLNHRQEIYAEFSVSCRQSSHVFHGAEEPLVDVSHPLEIDIMKNRGSGI